jgi:AcrR family transcriptional regulator
MALSSGPGLVERAAGPATDDTGRRLVAAAAEVFAEKGYDGAGVAEIARRAGLTTGAIYSRYSGKAELLAAAVEDCVPEQIEQLFAECAGGRATDLLRALGAHLVTRPPIGRTDLLLEAAVAGRRDPEVAAVVRGALRARQARWAPIIEAGKATGDLADDVDTDVLVHFAHAVALGFLVYEAVGVENPDPGPWDTLIAKLAASLNPASLHPSAPVRPAAGDTTLTGAPHGH